MSFKPTPLLIKIIKSFLCFAIGCYIFSSLVTYNTNDPSFNSVTSLPVKNIGGVVGAYLADLLWQVFGCGSLIFAIVPISWSYVYYKKGEIKHKFFKFLSTIIATLSLDALIRDIIHSNSYLLAPGGVTGILLKETFSHSGNGNVTDVISFILFVSCLYYSLSLSVSDWMSASNRINGLFNNLISKIINSLPSFRIQSLTKSSNLEITNKVKQTPTIINNIKEENKKTIVSSAFEDKNDTLMSSIKKTIQKPIFRETGNFILPSSDLLQNHPINKDVINQNRSLIKQNTEELQQILTDFGVSGEILGSASGPVVTLYELEPSAGTKSSRIIGLADDIARSMRATSARIAVIPGRNAIGIELPNKHRETVYLRELLESEEYQNKNYELPIILGKDISGNVVVADLAKMPHLLVAGTTGSGKSVAINTMILSLLYALTPEQCKFIMVDPKMLELSVYDGIPHLLTNVVTEPRKAVVALKWVVKEMENRYRLMSNLGVRNIHNYNERIKTAIANGEVIQRTVQTGFDPQTGQPIIEQVPLDMKTLPFIVVIVDEMADLMIVAGKEIEGSIQRLAQMARAAGIHIIMATQRPSVDVITGVIKANFPTRISFQVTSKIDSRTILGEQGAEQLLGKGDMLYMAGGSKITRIHGPFVADNEVEKIVTYLKNQAQPEYMSDITSEEGNFSSYGATGFNENNETDELYQQAVEIVKMEGKASTSFIQRCLKIGYNRAANIMEQMEKEGLVGKPNHVGKREILM